jgi:hypothetical protein
VVVNSEGRAMTMIRLDPATAAKFLAATGPVMLCDETGKPLRVCDLSEIGNLDEEPNYTEEEWQAIENEPGEMTTAELLAYLQSLEKP